MNSVIEARAARMALNTMIQNIEIEMRVQQERLEFLKYKRDELADSLDNNTPSWGVMATVEEVKKAVEQGRPVSYNYDGSFSSPWAERKYTRK